MGLLCDSMGSLGSGVGFVTWLDSTILGRYTELFAIVNLGHEFEMRVYVATGESAWSDGQVMGINLVLPFFN